MIAIDTNVVVRFLVRDDKKQSAAVYRRLKQAERDRERLFIPLLVILETIWVLESAYDRSRGEILEAIEDMRRMSVFEFEKDEVAERFLSDGRKCRADLADLLIARSSQSCGCETGITFDKAAAKLPFFSLLK
ncbi:MAG: type II toxin-antitoxin system VapC family toxin [Candidatus Erginobacter occultus]|nr:type II toxin-antitoxin system VapC family toxin [Candidatus Erginobacter occultus]